jgi:hypothetical protein
MILCILATFGIPLMQPFPIIPNHSQSFPTIPNHSQSFPIIPNHSLSKEIQNRSFTINIYDKFNYYGNIHIPRTPQFHSDNYYSLILFYLSQDKQYIKIYLSDMFFVQVGRVVHGNFTSRDVIWLIKILPFLEMSDNKPDARIITFKFMV